MKTRLRLKDEFKFLLVSLPVLILCFAFLNKTNEDFVKDCTSVGYSRNYCVERG